MNYAFFPGCSLESTGREFDWSTRAVCRALGIALRDIPDWVCCGSTPAHASNPALADALPALNLKKAEAMDLPVLTACASCYSRLRTANLRIQSKPEVMERVGRLIDEPYDGKVEVVHILDLLVNRFRVERIAEKIKKPLSGLKVACYYGCLLTRPPETTGFDDVEHPGSMDALLEAAGAEPIEWPFKTECCGAGLSITYSSTVSRLCHKLLSMARRAGAECLAVACPLCHANLDMRQEDALKAHGALEETPIFYVTQLLGLALDVPHEKLGLDRHLIDPLPMLRGIGVLP